MASKRLTLLGEYLQKRQLTQTRFAESAGVPAPMVSVWSRYAAARRRRPGRKNALAIAAATGGEVPAEYWDQLPTIPSAPASPSAPRRKPRRKIAHAA